MLTNKEIYYLLLQNEEIKEFQQFAGFKSRQALIFRLKSKELKNNLDGLYREFLLRKKYILQLEIEFSDEDEVKVKEVKVKRCDI